MDKKQANMIADLLNRRNKLDGEYYEEKVLKYAKNYECIVDKNDNLIAAVEIVSVQWYQWELRHLSVHESYIRKGHGTELIKKAEKKAEKGRARIIQCTIREDNERSKSLFEKNGYEHVSTFHNDRTRKNVGVWQKILIKPLIL